MLLKQASSVTGTVHLDKFDSQSILDFGLQASWCLGLLKAVADLRWFGVETGFQHTWCGNMIRALLLSLLLTLPVYGKYPYDSVGRVSAGGSCTLVYAANGKGIIITNAHVVSTISKTQAYWPAVKQKRLCKTIHVNFDYDLALLVCDKPPVQPVPYSRPGGMMIVSTGFPYYERSALHWQVSTIQSVQDNSLRVSAKPVPGMSGGGAFDYEGKLVAIVQGHDDECGWLISNQKLILTLAAYKDPKTWVPDASHVQDPKDFEIAEQDGQRRTIKYHENTAPSLRHL